MFFTTSQQHQTEQPARGFTLVESLIAITILLIVIISPMTIAARGLQSSFFANDQITAVYLAQESIEAVQKLRDENIIDVANGGGGETSTWAWVDDPTIDSCWNITGCDFNPETDDFEDCAGGCVLQINPDADTEEHRYGYEIGWDNSQYSRVVTMVDYEEDGVQLTATVSWNATLFGGEREVVLQTWLYDHDNRFEN
ncbi:type II secretion system protein [Candidatus Kaiserbacteria bacterium]|nr:type II secretion system protein [Candidatus Kaiserbacteria bacterium]